MIFELEGKIEKVFPPVQGIAKGRTWIRRDFTVRPKNMSTPIALNRSVTMHSCHSTAQTARIR